MSIPLEGPAAGVAEKRSPLLLAFLNHHGLPSSIRSDQRPGSLYQGRRMGSVSLTCSSAPLRRTEAVNATVLPPPKIRGTRARCEVTNSPLVVSIRARLDASPRSHKLSHSDTAQSSEPAHASAAPSNHPSFSTSTVKHPQDITVSSGPPRFRLSRFILSLPSRTRLRPAAHAVFIFSDARRLQHDPDQTGLAASPGPPCFQFPPIQIVLVPSVADQSAARRTVPKFGIRSLPLLVTIKTARSTRALTSETHNALTVHLPQQQA
ncbi:hypothetical protein V8E36_000511 [Tilletia maclaganii]